MVSTTLAELREYVRQESCAQRPAAGTVVLNVAHSNFSSTCFPELRFCVRDSIAEVKQRLFSVTGTLVSHMQLSLLGPDGRTLIAAIPDGADDALLGAFGPPQRGVIFVVDTDPFSKSKGGWLENTALVEKYTMSEESYAKRDGTYRKYREQRLQEDPKWTLKREMALRRGAEPDEQHAESAPSNKAVALSAGDRCRVFPGARAGVVRFVGSVPELPGDADEVWVGVEYNEPVGKNDGSIAGRRVFQCRGPKFGGFVRAANVSKTEDGCHSEDELEGLLSSEDEI